MTKTIEELQAAVEKARANYVAALNADTTLDALDAARRAWSAAQRILDDTTLDAAKAALKQGEKK
jgi:hypothetical protein